MSADHDLDFLPADPAVDAAELRVLEQDWTRLTDHVLADGDEHAAILLCGVARHGQRLTYLVREVILLMDGDYVRRGRAHLSIAPVTLARAAKRARLSQAALVLVHSHPFPGRVRASGIDLRTELDLCRRVLTERTGMPAAALVIGPDGVDARTWTSAGASPLHTVHVIGEQVQRVPATSWGLPVTSFSDSAGPRDHAGTTDRQELLWGAVGQETLRRSRITVVGCGGTGSHIAIQLAHLRIGELTLIDDDLVEASNLSRIVGATPHDIGQPKTDVLAKLCRAISPHTTVNPVTESVLDVDPGTYIHSDVLVCATDSHGSRSLLSEAATQYLLPFVDLGVEVVPGTTTFRAGGGVRVLLPGQGCLWCAQTLSPARVREDYLDAGQRAAEARHGYIRDSSEPAPSVIALNGVVSSLAVLEVCQLLVGMLGGGRSRLLYRAEERALGTAALPHNPTCHVCGSEGVLALGDTRALPTRRPACFLDTHVGLL
jgi:molybdopterin/thiamine biosynthesis adenylyltransferase